jgi:integrase
VLVFLQERIWDYGRKKRTDSKGRVLKDNELQRKDGSYMFRYRNENGVLKTVYSWKLVPTDKTPRGKRDGLSLREKEDLVKQDQFNGIDSGTAKKATLNQIFDKYIAGKTELKQSTLNNYLYMYNHFVRNSLGKRKIAKIKYSDILSFYKSLIKDMGFKPTSMEIIHSLLHPTFTLAVRDDVILKNPTNGAMAEIKKSHCWEKTKRHALTEEQQTAFVNYVANSDTYSHWLPLFTTFLGTGCRVGELIGLRWCDCDFKNNTISINHNLTYRPQENRNCEFHITTPKTGAGVRNIPMLTAVREVLIDERKRQLANGFCSVEIDGYSGFIFKNQVGSVHTPTAINRAIDRIHKAYNKEEIEKARQENREPLLLPHFSVHTFRHTFCTRFCENETNVKIIQEIMGHSSITITMDIYNEATDSKKQEAFKNLDSKIRIC